jgi:diacylglycerol kinase family enzyme
MSRVVAIWNPASGNAPDPDDLRRRFDEVFPGERVELLATSEEDHGAGVTAQALRDGAEVVVVCGGDGTVQACLDPLAGAAATLSVLPLGTGNLLASNLRRVGEVDELDVSGEPSRDIDVGRVNGEPFAVMAGTGFDALMIRDADDGTKSRLGTVAYVFSALRHLRESLVDTTVEVDGEEIHRGPTSMVLVGNFGTISGGIDVFPEATPDDGRLDVTVLRAASLRDWLRVARHMLRSRGDDLEPLLHRARGREITITQARPRPYELDGEVREATTTLDITVEPGVLTVQHGDEDA